MNFTYASEICVESRLLVSSNIKTDDSKVSQLSKIPQLSVESIYGIAFHFEIKIELKQGISPDQLQTYNWLYMKSQ